MSTIWIDGDGCPKLAVRFATEEGERRGLQVMLVTNIHHEQQAPGRLVVDGRSQSVDLAIINRLQAEDVVITQDMGLAALALGKKGYALSPNGHEYRTEDVTLMLEMRESAAKHRRGGGRTKGPKKRTAEDEERFQLGLVSLLDRIARE